MGATPVPVEIAAEPYELEPDATYPGLLRSA